MRFYRRGGDEKPRRGIFTAIRGLRVSRIASCPYPSSFFSLLSALNVAQRFFDTLEILALAAVDVAHPLVTVASRIAPPVMAAIMRLLSRLKIVDHSSKVVLSQSCGPLTEGLIEDTVTI
jgi:hypothetical protein